MGIASPSAATIVIGDRWSQPISPEREEKRVSRIRDLELIKGGFPEMETLAKLGADLLGVSACMITIVDAEIVWVIAKVGADIDQVPRHEAFCSHVVAFGRPLIVPDLSADPRFQSNPFVSGEGLRLYAGHPISLGDDVALGTICVIGRQPRRLTSQDEQTLEHLANLTNALLIKHRSGKDADKHLRELGRRAATIQSLARDLAAQKRIIEAAADLAKVGAWEVDLETNQLLWSEGMYRIHGMNPAEGVSYGAHYDMYPEPHRTRIKRAAGRARAQEGSFDVEAPAITADGRRRWFRIAGGMQFEDGRPVRWSGMKQDITRQKRLLHRIERLATLDPVTGLHNRAAMLSLFKKSTAKRRPLGVLLMDLDGFKRVNDVHGQLTGDACLRAVASRLKRVCKGAQLIARLGGDEFAIVLGYGAAPQDIEILAQRLVAALRDPIKFQKFNVHLGASIGVAHSATSGAELYRRADLALYAAKAGGRGTWRLFTPAINHAAETRFREIENIREALSRGELLVYYQQKVRLADNSHEGFEALIRWRRGDGSVVGPADFTAALDDAEVSVGIGDFVLRDVLRQIKKWQADRVDFGRVAINLSAAQLMNDKIVEQITSSLAVAGLSPAVLEVEVTEGVFLDAQSGRVRKALRALRRAGVRVALDDFGTGFASLSHLGQLHVDVLKIDRSFVSRLGRSAKDTAIVQFLVQLANSLSIEVVAEGIENARQAEFLRTIGCTYGQGYWFSRPEDAQSSTQLIRQHMPELVW